jgi:mannose-6-phosphate isomerase-like protein (cupin superfamily)
MCDGCDMEIIRASSSRRFDGGPTFVSHEYDTHDPDINLARVEIRGRVPDKGTMRNTKVKEIVYVEEGKGTITINGERHEIEKGAVILFAPNEEVVWEGEFVLITACTPSWTLEQHEKLG